MHCVSLCKPELTTIYYYSSNKTIAVIGISLDFFFINKNDKLKLLIF